MYSVKRKYDVDEEVKLFNSILECAIHSEEGYPLVEKIKELSKLKGFKVRIIFLLKIIKGIFPNKKTFLVPSNSTTFPVPSPLQILCNFCNF